MGLKFVYVKADGREVLLVGIPSGTEKKGVGELPGEPL